MSELNRTFQVITILFGIIPNILEPSFLLYTLGLTREITFTPLGLLSLFICYVRIFRSIEADRRSSL